MSTKTYEQRSAAQEAQRYLDNARTILSEKAGKKDVLYADVKYVKIGFRNSLFCGTAHFG